MRLYRSGNLIDPAVLAQSTVVHLGVGGLGSQIAGLLAYGFKNIVLIDHDFITEEVIERHLIFDHQEIGRPKVDAVADWLIKGGVEPERIIKHHKRVHQVLDNYTNATVVVSTVNIPTVDNYINDWCQRHNIPAFYPGVFQNGTGGRIIAIPKPREICYVCATQDIDGFDFSEPQGCGISIDQLAVEEGGLHAVPALRWAITAIAADAVDFTLDLLKGGGQQAEMFLHAHNCEDQFVIAEHELAGWQAYVSMQSTLGIVPNLRITEYEGQPLLQVKRGTLTFPIERWKECPAAAHTVAGQTP